MYVLLYRFKLITNLLQGTRDLKRKIKKLMSIILHKSSTGKIIIIFEFVYKSLYLGIYIYNAYYLLAHFNVS